MSEPRGGDAAFPPAMDSRNRGTDHARDRTGAVQSFDDAICERLHTKHNAIIATSKQGPSAAACGYRINKKQSACESSFCFPGQHSLFGGMDMDHVKRRMAERNISQVTVAAALGMDPTAVSKMLNGKRKVSAREAAVLSELLEIENVGYMPIRQLPVIGRVSAGQWAEAIEAPLDTVPCPDPSLPDSVFVVEVDGDSMDKIVQPGARIIVDPTDRDLMARRTYVVRNGSGESTFKQFMADPARLEPCSSNPEHHTIYPGRDHFEIIGRVVYRIERM